MLVLLITGTGAYWGGTDTTEIGLSASNGRRVRGLRREEVAVHPGEGPTGTPHRTRFRILSGRWLAFPLNQLLKHIWKGGRISGHRGRLSAMARTLTGQSHRCS